jgi:hypothetical protein
MFVADVHIFAFIVYSASLLLLISGLFQIILGDFHLGSSFMVTAANMFLWLLYHNKLLYRVVILMLNFQFIFNILPICSYFWVQEKKSTVTKAEVRANIGYQGSVVYAMVQLYFVYSIVNIVNMDVNADFATVGFVRNDVYPIMNGFLIGMGKIGIFVFGGLYLWHVSKVIQKTAEQIHSRQINPLSRYLQLELVGVVVVLYFLTTSLGK